MINRSWSLLAAIWIVASGFLVAQEPLPSLKDFEERLRKAEEGNRKLIEVKSELVSKRAASIEARAARITKDIEALEQRAAELERRMTSMLTDDAGKRLASDNQAISTFMQFQDEVLLQPEALTGMKAVVRNAQARIGLSPASVEANEEALINIDAELHEPDFRCRLVRERVDNRLNWLDLTVERCKVIDLTTAKPLRDFIVAILAKREADIAEIRGQVRKESDELLKQQARAAEAERGKMAVEQMLAAERSKNAAMQAMIERKEAASLIAFENEKAALRREIEDAKAARRIEDIRTDLERAKKVDDAEKQLLIRRCQDPTVKAKLLTFTTPGYQQPNGGNFGKDRGTDKKPVSFEGLKATGMLEETNAGRNALVKWVTHHQDERPKFGFVRIPHVERMSPQELDKLIEVQKLVIELGPTLVELGMLSK